MEPRWQQLVAEEKDLDSKCQKLMAFLGSDIAQQLHPIEQTLLLAQYHAMQTYLFILRERILKCGNTK